MLKRSLMIAASSVALAAAVASPSLAAPADFVGTWVNKDNNTRGVTRLVITSAGSNKLNIQVFGKCHPTDCDWGTVPVVTYGLNVQDTNHTYATANYTKGFSNTLLTLNHAGSQIMLQGFTQFLDNSGRQNYYSRDYFQRTLKVKIPGGLPISPIQPNR
ncbi:MULTISPECIES: hypothetical protein [unclassified Tolypothrix]|uniref:hypothetical protein n=1 Tax=unclassified Tolypothrix TaxID=2649714 RepID=UPI00069384F6|nr:MULTISPECIES: hypothetical protein [unclassified Tolypothrix]MBE9085016.1 hypothetical protein [Tolypothrix sp. LEGE 11397]UYD24316.1 hypothetical protein HGR01_22935 [Tolypothrix sp. PCC 7712]UYD33452.1 hypothetical protein HG267_31750 [Tolypothrix sp. PCC 7601]BAY90098.1 hypothetical protein NIES3275_21080 [Microchaete diplosiphon NIES-3275]